MKLQPKAVALITGCLVSLAQGAVDSSAAPLVASYEAGPSTLNGATIKDAGPSGADGIAKGVQIAEIQDGPGKDSSGKVFRVAGKDSTIELPAAFGDRLMKAMSFTTWIRIDDAKAVNGNWILWKGGNSGFQVGMYDTHQLYLHGYTGDWIQGGAGRAALPIKRWFHLAISCRFPGEITAYVDGKRVGGLKAEGVIYPVDDPWRVGGGSWSGLLDKIRFYGAALDEAQVWADMNGTLKARAVRPTELPEPTFGVKAYLARFDMPRGNTDIGQLTRFPAERRNGPDAIDWPSFRLQRAGMAPIELFKDSATQYFETSKPGGAQNDAISRQTGDLAIDPLDCWVRPVAWRWGQFYIHGGGNGFRSSSGGFEIWGYPVRMTSPGGIHDVELDYGGLHYQRKDDLNSLTLILPQNPSSWQYALKVNGHGPLVFDVGLQPIVFGNPCNVPLQIDATIPGADIAVRSVAKPESFPNPREWAKAIQEMSAGKAMQERPSIPTASTMAGRMGVEVPRSPISINLCFQRFGMSGNFYFPGSHGGFKGSLAEYVALLKGIGFDRDIESVSEARSPSDNPEYATWIVACSKAGMQGMLNPAGDIITHANLGLFGATIPECNEPGRREAQLLAQRFRECPAFKGIISGGDNAGYVSFWHWAPPNPNRPWLRAMDVVLAGRKHEIPLPPSAGRHTSLDGAGSMREFQNYIARYDAAFSFSYRHFTDALKEIDPRLVYTTGSFGSSPGALARGGYPIGSMPGLEMHAGLDVQMTYDWSEEGSSKPLHNVALIDRLRSYFPEKETWANLDDFGIILGREARQRAYAIALTRGVKAVGSNCLSLPDGTGYVNDFKGTYGQEPLDNQHELFAWIHTFGGPYAMMEPEASIGVLYVHAQAVCRHTGAPDPEGPHEGKTTEALFLCHAAGWPAKIVTPEELKRGLPPTMKALLLTGLNKFEGDWQWSEGLEDALAAFVKGGGRIVQDHESVCPVTAVKTDMKICAYAPQSHVDFSPLLLQRNQENARKLNVALEGVQKPAVTGSDTAWAIPSRAGDVRYVTVVNWLPRLLPDDKDGKPCYANGSRKDGVSPQIARLAWRVTGPIYDLRAGKVVSPDQASSCDLTRDAFRLYALPPQEPTAPAVSFRDRTDGWVCASVDVAGMKGVPVKLALACDGDQATVFSASGLIIQLPVRAGDKPGVVKVLTTELLSGKTSESELEIKAVRQPAPRGPVSPCDAAAIRTFMTRNVPLAIALTPAQEADPDMARLAARLQEIAARRGRAAVLKEISTNAFIVSLQELKPSMYVGPGFPQWRTEPDDVILLGTPQENPLLYDELRGGLLPSDALASEQGHASLGHAWSPFVFGRHAVNLIAPDQAGLATAVDALARLLETR